MGLIGLMGLMGLMGGGGLRAEMAGAAVVATVNGDSVTGEEVREAMTRLRAGHGEEAEWKAVALEECVRTKIILQSARARGLGVVVADAELHEAHRAENQRRREAVARGEPIYGPRQFTWAMFRVWYLDGVERALRRAVVAARPAPTHSELAAFHTARPELFTPAGGTVPAAFEAAGDGVRQRWEEQVYREFLASARGKAEVRIDDAAVKQLRWDAGPAGDR